MKRLILLSTFLLLLIGCPLLPTSYDPLEQGIEPWMRSQWHTAQNELSQLVPIPHDPRRRRGVFDISIDRFTFRKEPDIFKCGPITTYGCFHPGGRLIRWWGGSPDVVKHEAKHAILWALGDSRWPCIEHPDEVCPGG